MKYKIARRQGEGHKVFLAVSLAILIVSVFVHFGVAILNYMKVTDYPKEAIFMEESITASSTRAAEAGHKLVPVGATVGVRFYTQGIMVLGGGEVAAADGSFHKPSEGKLFAGDMVVKAGGRAVASVAELADAISAAAGDITLEVVRDSAAVHVTITPVKGKIGAWVRDSTQGIGTVTYYDPDTGRFGALGHGIMDVDTRRLLTVRSGWIYESNILDVRKGKKGEPGEIIGEICPDIIIGTITKNSSLGIYGDINRNYAKLPATAFATARRDDIRIGPAKIFSNIEGKGIKPYDIYIESVNQDSASDKSMVVRITDQALITNSGGIVQGMSGSPILQGDKIVGAVTHVFVQNPLRGYGVFIEKMVAEGRA